MNKVILVMLLAISFLNADVKKEFYSNGALKYKVTYDTDSTSGCTIRTYFRNGNLKKELVYADNTNKRCDSFK